MTRPKHRKWQEIDDVEAWIPNPFWYYYQVGDGLIFYEPCGDHVYLHTAIEELPPRPCEALIENFNEMKKRGFVKVYAYIDHGHHLACRMARAAGMTRVDFDYGNLFERVL